MRRQPALPAPPPDGGAHTCYLAVRDDTERCRLAADLRSLGWNVVEHATAFHLLADVCDYILGSRPWESVGSIVVEEASPGCRGATVEEGLRDLGVTIPVVLVPGARRAPPSKPTIDSLPTAA